MKKKLRIYIDTSVIGGCIDDEFKEWSNRLIKEFKIGLHNPCNLRINTGRNKQSSTGSSRYTG